MSFTEPDLDELEADQPDDTELAKKLRRQIRDQKSQLRTQSEQISQGTEAAKRLAFLEAKLPESPQVAYFLSTYQGEMTAEAIREAAAANGFIEPDQDVTDDIADIEAMSQTANGAVPPIPAGSLAARDAEIEAITGTKNGMSVAQQIKAINRKFGVPLAEDLE